MKRGTTCKTNWKDSKLRETSKTSETVSLNTIPTCDWSLGVIRVVALPLLSMGVTVTVTFSAHSSHGVTGVSVCFNLPSGMK